MNRFGSISIRAVAWSGLLGLLLGMGACGGSSGGGGNTGCGSFDCKGMLENLGNNVMFPAMESLESETSAMAQAAADYETAVGTSDEEAALADLRDQWRASMAVLQQVEVMQVGPLAADDGARRDNLYSWPVTNSCGVDQDVIFADNGQLPDGSDYDITARTPDRRGMDALEYILFTETLEHTCPSTVSATENWNDRPEGDRIAARANYIAIVADDIANQTGELVALWDGSSGDFLTELTEPGSGESRFDDAQDAVNAVSDALFYVEKQTKDVKLAKPLGQIENGCSGDPCPRDVESPYSRNSRQNIHNNLLAFQQLFLGGGSGPNEDGLGFDDYLEDVGEENVASVMATDVADAIEAVSDSRFSDSSLYDALQDDVSSVEGAHDATKKVTDRLKNEFISVLGLSIPDTVGGDTD